MNILSKRFWLQLMAEGAAEGTGDNGLVAADEAAQEEQPVDLEAEFDGLVKKDGKFRDVYGKRVQKAIAERTKGIRGDAEKYRSLAPALDMLAAKYGVAANDPKLVQLISEDKSLLEDRALRNGNSTETEAAIVRLEAERNKAQEVLRQVLAERDAQAWSEQAKELGKRFPGADVQGALSNPQFRALMQAPYNLDFKTAYMAMFGENLIEQAAAKERKKVTDTVAAGAKRPRENGMGSQAGAAAAIDWEHMPKAEFAEYMKRAERGEKIPL